MPAQQPRVAYVITDAASLVLLAGELAWMQGAGFAVCVAGNGVSRAGTDALPSQVERFEVPFRRDVAPAHDLRALVVLWRTLRRWRPDIVHVSTPKAGLLGGVAARAAGVRHRLYLVRGLRYETARGPTRALLLAAERGALAAATRVHAVSRSVVRRGVADGLVGLSAARVIGEGSSMGVDAERFRPRPSPGFAVRSAKERLGLGHGPVIGYVGRIAGDKGCGDLLQAFDRAAQDHPEAQLLVVGAADPTDPVPARFWSRAQADERVHLIGPLTDVRPALYAMDVVALLSYREGFGNVILEAAATGIPAVAYRSTGLVDAVVDGVTGLLTAIGDAEAAGEALSAYLAAPQRRADHGRAAQRRAATSFRPEDIWAEVEAGYRAMLADGARPGPAPTPSATPRPPATG